MSASLVVDEVVGLLQRRYGNPLQSHARLGTQSLGDADVARTGFSGM